MSSIFPEQLMQDAASVLAAARKSNLRLATAETVTAGLVSACLTSVSGASEVFERGFVLYHNSAKASGLGLGAEVSSRYGAVSAEVTRGLAEGALEHSQAEAAVAVTGYAGPAAAMPPIQSVPSMSPLRAAAARRTESGTSLQAVATRCGSPRSAPLSDSSNRLWTVKYK